MDTILLVKDYSFFELGALLKDFDDCVDFCIKYQLLPSRNAHDCIDCNEKKWYNGLENKETRTCHTVSTAWKRRVLVQIYKCKAWLLFICGWRTCALDYFYFCYVVMTVTIGEGHVV